MYIIGLVLLRAGNFLLLPVYTALLDTDEYGVVSVVLKIVELLVLIGLAGQTQALLRLGVDQEEGSEGIEPLLGTQIGVILVLCSVLAGGMALSWSFLSPYLGGIPLWPVGTAGLVGVWAMAIFRYQLAYHQLMGRARLHTIFGLARWGVLIGLLLLFIVGLDWGATGMLLATSLSFIFGAAIIWVRFPKKIVIGLRGSIAKPALMYGLPFIPHAIAGIMLQATDRIVLAASTDLSTVGLYALAANLSSGVIIIATGMQTAWTPFLLRAHRDSDQQSLNIIPHYALGMHGLVALGVLCLALTAPEVIAILTRDSYADAAYVIPVLACVGLFRSFYFAHVAVAMTEGKVARYLVAVSLPAALLNLVLNILWIPKYGALGAAFATLAASILLTVGALRLSRAAFVVPFAFVREFSLVLIVALALWAGWQQPLGTRLGLLFGAVVLTFAVTGRALSGAVQAILGRTVHAVAEGGQTDATQ